MHLATSSKNISNKNTTSSEPFPVPSICKQPVSSPNKSPDDLGEDSLVSITSLSSEQLISQLFPGLEDDSGLKELIHSQVTNRSKTEKRQYRWSQRIIKLSLMLWGRSPSAYEDLCSSGFLILPSSRLLRYYKNAIQQKPGIQHDVFLWMRKEADKINLNQITREGGLILDEMSIQEDVYIQNDGMLCGLTDLGEASEAVGILRRGKSHASIASHVLQLVYLGDTGFRFPFSHYPSRECTAVDLFSIIWENIACLRDYGFRVNYISMDGASMNRTLMKMHFGATSVNTLRKAMFEVPNPMPPNKTIIFIMDPSIRNNLLKSGDRKTDKRNLYIRGKPLYWKWWKAAYSWDRSANSMRIHHRLTQEHIFPDSANKMRNHLAEEILNRDMLYLMQCYQRALTPEEARNLDIVVEFLSNTSTFIKIFRDLRPVLESNDERLTQLNTVHSWFLSWETDVLSQISVLPKEKTNFKKKTYVRPDKRGYFICYSGVYKALSKQNPENNSRWYCASQSQH